MHRYAVGRSSGVVVESGASLSQVVPVYQHLVIPHAVVPGGISGSDLTCYTTNLLGLGQSGNPGKDTARAFKERQCFFAIDSSNDDAKQEGWDELRAFIARCENGPSLDEKELKIEGDFDPVANFSLLQKLDLAACATARTKAPELLFHPRRLTDEAGVDECDVSLAASTYLLPALAEIVAACR